VASREGIPRRGIVVANLREIVRLDERQHVDLKGPIAFEGDHRFELTKDIIAMANTRDGGTIVIGVSEDRENGGLRFDGVSADQARTFDVTKVHDFVRERVAPPVKLFVETVEEEDGLFLLLQVPEFEIQPHVCTKDANTSGNKLVFRKGDVLVRTEGAKSERISDEAGMRQLPNVGVQRRADAILADISRLLRGDREGEGPESTWAVTETLASEVSRRKEKYANVGAWTFVLHSARPFDNAQPHAALRKSLLATQVDLRGWDFPHATDNDLVNRKDPASQLAFIYDETDWCDHVEAVALFSSGYFQYERLLREDLEAQDMIGGTNARRPGIYLDWLQAIWTVGEFLLFAARLYRELAYEGRLIYEVQLHRMKGRVLKTRIPGRNLSYERRCAEDEIVVRGEIDVTVLRADVATESLSVLKEIFALFHWSDASEKMLREDLQKLFERRLG
jgi:hypothetical protein